MAVGKNSTRIGATISKDDYNKLREIADKQNRSISNLINMIIKQYINSK